MIESNFSMRLLVTILVCCVAVTASPSRADVPLAAEQQSLSRDRQSFQEIPLDQLQGPTLSGDLNQLPLLVFSNLLGTANADV